MSIRKFKAAAVDGNGQRYTARGKANIPDHYPDRGGKNLVRYQLWQNGLSTTPDDIELDPED